MIALVDALEDNDNLRTMFDYMAIFGAMMLVSLIIALVSLDVLRSILEIGVRKVLRASATKIITLRECAFCYTLVSASVIGSIRSYVLTDSLL